MSGSEFKDFQKFMGWSARECARRLNKSVNTISNWRNKGVPESESVIVRLACEALKSGIRI